jgi:hypothetical protein
LVAAGFVAHQLNFIPGLDTLQVSVGPSAAQGATSMGVAFTVLPLAQALTLCAGLSVTTTVLWTQRRQAS